MYLNKMSLVTAKQSEKIINKVNFRKGVNFVVDTEDSSRHNRVGKTTFLRLIDVALGAKDKKNIYTDDETNDVNKELLCIIKKNKTSVRLVVSEEWNSDITHTLEVQLFPRGRYYIDGEKYNFKNYKKKLNELFFNNVENIPAFRNLIHSFVRISLKNDDNSFLKNIPRASYNIYRSVYNYLFDISDPKINQELDNLQKKSNINKAALRRYQSLNGFSEVDQIKQVINNLKVTASEQEAALDDLLSEKDFQRNRRNINRVRKEYSLLSDKIGEIQFQIERNNEAIKQQEQSFENSADINLLKDFYNEVSISSSIQKEFNDLLSFNSQLKDNKIQYYKEVNKSLQKKEKEIRAKKRELENNNEGLFSLIKNNKIEDYTKLSNKLSKTKSEISAREENIKILQGLVDANKEIASKIGELKEKQKRKIDYNHNFEIFNSYFKKYAKKINKEEPILIYNSDASAFPVSITNLYEGTSTGTRKSLIAAYDLAYQQFAKDINKKIPNFIVHDVLENIEGENFKSIIDIVEKTNSQYIVAVLKEKLDSAGISQNEQDKHTILKLSTKDRLFKD